MVVQLLTLILAGQPWPAVYVHQVDSAEARSIYEQWVVPSPFVNGRWHTTWGGLCRLEARRYASHSYMGMERASWERTTAGWYRVDPHPLLEERLPDVTLYLCPHPMEDLGQMVAVRKGELYLLPRQLVVLLRDCGTSFAPDSIMGWAPTFTVLFTAHERLRIPWTRVQSVREADSLRAALIRKGAEPLIPVMSIERAWIGLSTRDAQSRERRRDSLYVGYHAAGEERTLHCPVRNWQPSAGGDTLVVPADMPGSEWMILERLPLEAYPVGQMTEWLLWPAGELALYCIVLALGRYLTRPRRHSLLRRRLIRPEFDSGSQIGFPRRH